MVATPSPRERVAQAARALLDAVAAANGPIAGTAESAQAVNLGRALQQVIVAQARAEDADAAAIRNGIALGLAHFFIGIDLPTEDLPGALALLGKDAAEFVIHIRAGLQLSAMPAAGEA